MSLQQPATMTPVKKTNYHHGNLRISIIYSVAQLIGEENGINFQLKDVAKLVGTSQPAIYKHFAGKKALLVETAVEGYSLQKEFRDQAFENTDGSPLSKVFALAQAYVNFSRTHPGFFLLMKNLETKEILSSKRYLSERQESLSLATGLVQECLSDGSFTNVDPQIAMTVLQSIVYGLAHLYITNQIKLIAPDSNNVHNFQEQVIVTSLESLLTKKGKREITKIANDYFSDSLTASGIKHR